MTWGTIYFQTTQMTGVRKVSVKKKRLQMCRGLGSMDQRFQRKLNGHWQDDLKQTDNQFTTKDIKPKRGNTMDTSIFPIFIASDFPCIARKRSSEPGTLTSQRCCPSRRWKTRRWKFGQCGTRGLDQDGKFVMDRTWMVSPIQSSSNIRNDVVGYLFIYLSIYLSEYLSEYLS